MNNPVLSICIPTYNRAGCLRQCLDSIAEQLKDLEVEAKIEVVISDNASSDGTESVVKEFQAKFAKIYYYKNSENLGFDRNALQLVEKAHGEFVWLLGDDDALFPDAVAYILKQLQGEKFKYCVVNYWGYNNSLSAPALKRPDSGIEADKYFVHLSEFVKVAKKGKSLVGLFCGLSSQVFNRELWLNCPDKKQYIGSDAVHLYILLSVMKDQGFALFAKPLVKVRADNIRWETFPGLATLKKRTWATHKILLWILERYEVPHSRLLLLLGYYQDYLYNRLLISMRKTLFKSQGSRDKLKKILGKL